MSTVEEDVARINAVSVALQGPTIIWVAQWSNKDDDGIEVFVSEAGARAQLLRWLDSEKDELDLSDGDFRATRQAIIDRVRFDFDDQGNRWYSIRSEALRS